MSSEEPRRDTSEGLELLRSHLLSDLDGEEPVNPHVELEVPFHYFFLRKLALVKYTCAFVCFPGGYGTLDELFEALNLVRTHRLAPFPVLLYGPEYWSGLVDWLRTSPVEAGSLCRRLGIST